MSGSYTVRTIRRTDFAQCVALTDLMDWGLADEDFTFMVRLEAEGCFVAARGTNILGLVTSVSFGNLGWIGNVIVSPRERKKGVGAALVTRAVEYLKNRGVETIGLYAYKNVVPFYKNLGFSLSIEYSWMKCEYSNWGGAGYSHLRKTDFPAIVEFDEACFGGTRTRLLKAIYESPSSLCCSFLEEKCARAYLMAVKSQTSAEIGPWLCKKGYEEEAFQLFKSIGKELHGLETHIGLPTSRHDLISFVTDLGFKENFHVVRMYHGPHPQDKECVLAMESLERG